MSGQHLASEAAAEKAIEVLKRAIEAAENSNQAGENFVVAAAHAPEMLGALDGLLGDSECTCTFPSDDCCSVGIGQAVLAKARGDAS